MDVLRNMVEAVRPGGTILDLQVIRPDPRVERHGELVDDFAGKERRLPDDAVPRLLAMTRPCAVRERCRLRRLRVR